MSDTAREVANTDALNAEAARAGMNVAGVDNRQFALNVLHWLSGTLGDE